MRSWAEVLEIFICAVWARVLHAALSLGEQVQQFQPGRVGQGLADPGELLVQGHLPRVLVHRVLFLQYPLEYCIMG